MIKPLRWLMPLLGSCTLFLPLINAKRCDEADFANSCEGNAVLICDAGFTREIGCGSGSCNPATATCDGCGDGVLQAPEECDDFNLSNEDACTAICLNNICGDSFLNITVEACDDGNLTNDDGCSSACQNEVCGDGVAQSGEACDGGDLKGQDCVTINQNFAGGTLACDGVCAFNTSGCNSCGNNTVDAGEQCDDGNAINTDACLATCQNAFCGDGFVQATVEECEDGNQNNADACRNDCTLNPCGNGNIDAGEQCDDAGRLNGDGCNNVCQIEIGGACNPNNSVNGQESPCDGTDLDGASCQSLGYSSGVLACNNCDFNIAGCIP
jgi:cysteine-rich repeat protein